MSDFPILMKMHKYCSYALQSCNICAFSFSSNTLMCYFHTEAFTNSDTIYINANGEGSFLLMTKHICVWLRFIQKNLRSMHIVH